MDFITTSLVFFVLLISTTTTKAVDSYGSQTDGSDLSVIPFFGTFDPLKPVAFANNDPQRLKFLSQESMSAPIASGQVLNIGNYVVRAKMGTPGQLMFMVLDISNDGIWLPCSGCTGCSGATNFKPNISSSYKTLTCADPKCTQLLPKISCPAPGSATCAFNQSYGGDSSFSATLVQDSLRLANDVIQNVAFGCINSVSGGGTVPPQGLLGLGRGMTSLISSYEAGSYSGTFSYCLPSFRSYYFTGSLRLGPSGQPVNIRTTPLLFNLHRSSLYYVNLTGVSVGRVKVPIASELFSFNPYTGAGTIIDSGTVITRFLPPAYGAIRDEFRKQMGGPFSTLGAFDTCFTDTGGVVAPAITFHFEGLDMRLPLENSLIHSSSGTLACLSMAAMPNNANAVMNVIANLQQQNFRILFDLPNSRVGIARELCN